MSSRSRETDHFRPGAFLGTRCHVAGAGGAERFEDILRDAILAQTVDASCQPFDFVVRAPTRGIHARKARCVLNRKTLGDAKMHGRVVGFARKGGGEVRKRFLQQNRGPFAIF